MIGVFDEQYDEHELLQDEIGYIYILIEYEQIDLFLIM
jgi:hypothetical protein